MPTPSTGFAGSPSVTASACPQRRDCEGIGGCGGGQRRFQAGATAPLLKFPHAEQGALRAPVLRERGGGRLPIDTETVPLLTVRRLREDIARKIIKKPAAVQVLPPVVPVVCAL